MQHRVSRALAGAALAATLLPACGTGSAASAGSVKIGALYPTAGPQGPQGSEEQHGVALAAEWANTHHLLGGSRLQLVMAPADRAEEVPGSIASLVQRGVQVIVGSHGSSISAVAAQTASEQHLLLWETGAVGETMPGTNGGRSFFRMAPMGANLGAAGISFMAQQYVPQLGLSRALRYAVTYVDDPYGRAVTQGALDEISRLGLELVGTFPYTTVHPDYDALAARIAAARPDVVYASAYLDDGVALRRSMVAHHMPLLGGIGTSSSYCHLRFGQELGPDAVGLFASDKPDAGHVRADSLSSEGRTALVWASATYQSRYHQPMSAPALSGFSGAYALFVHVLPRTKHQTAAQVAPMALETKLPEGTLANGAGMDFAPPGAADAGDNRAAAGVIWEWVGPGERAVVWPPAYAQHPISVIPLAR
jgi:branched-chain amino acid transport system substrate-binding protein